MTEPGSSFQFGVDHQTGLATIHEFMTLEAEVDARCRSNGDGDAYGIVLVDIEGIEGRQRELRIRFRRPGLGRDRQASSRHVR
jgi:hypothetical protein